MVWTYALNASHEGGGIEKIIVEYVRAQLVTYHAQRSGMENATRDIGAWTPARLLGL